jgi:hypothetical protein
VIATDTRELVTYTSLSTYRNCRKKYFWRYVESLIPMERDDALGLGSLIHVCLKLWHETRDISAVLQVIDSETAQRTIHDWQRKYWHLSRSMMWGYANLYPVEDFQPIALEQPFRAEIRNPETGSSSRTFLMAGKVDGLISLNGSAFLLEHKTASNIGAGYLERLWTDFQVALYVKYVQEALGVKLDGVLYNVIEKPGLLQAKGETEEEFQVRYAELCQKNKSGKSSAKRQLIESDTDYQARLQEKMSDPSMYHREILIISESRIREIESEVWELAQNLLFSRRTGRWYQNTTFCFHWNKPCCYYPLCKSGGSELVKSEFYRHEPPHKELREEPEQGE